MESKTKYALALGLLFALVLALRLLVSFQVAEPGYASYFTLIQADAIKEHGVPRYEDPYSWRGRSYAFPPLFHYLVALCALLLPKTLALKLLPNLFMACLVPLVYLLGYRLTKSRWASLAAGAFAGFAPILFTTFLNEAVPMSLALPVSAALLLTLFELEEHPLRALLLTALLTLLSPIIWLFLGAYVAYFLILLGERLSIPAQYQELALFTFLGAAWYTLITYKEALGLYAFSIIQGSLPESVRAATFSEFTFLAMILAVGVIPLALGSIALYHATFEVRSRRALLVASFGLVTLLGALLRLLPLRTALLLLSLVFILLSAQGFHLLVTYTRKLRASSAAPVAIAIVLLLFILTSMLPSLATGVYPQSSPTRSELEALSWVRTSTPEKSILLAAPRSGFLINHEARRKYIADEAYLLIPNPEATLADIDAIYTTPSTVAAAELLGKHGVTHILLGPRENARYPELGALLKDRNCFPILYRNPQTLILGVNCSVTGGGR